MDRQAGTFFVAEGIEIGIGSRSLGVGVPAVGWIVTRIRWQKTSWRGESWPEGEDKQVVD